MLVRKAQSPLRVGVPPIYFGNMPVDGGHLILQTPGEHTQLLKDEPGAAKFILPMLDAQDFLSGRTRWALWLKDAEPHELKKLPEVMKRVEKVRQWRLGNVASSTRKFAATPTLFRDRRLPASYVTVPKVSSERCEYVPMRFLTSDTVVNDLLFMVPDADLFHFGVMTSGMHMAWMRHVGGRLESRYRYAKDMVYNTFPWPDRASLKPAQVEAVKNAAQQVLDARTAHADSTLADLYDPRVMPVDLRGAHTTLDRAVERCYRPAAFKTELERLTFLLEECQRLAPAPLLSALPAVPPKRRNRKPKVDI